MVKMSFKKRRIALVIFLFATLLLNSKFVQAEEEFSENELNSNGPHSWGIQECYCTQKGELRLYKRSMGHKSDRLLRDYHSFTACEDHLENHSECEFTS